MVIRWSIKGQVRCWILKLILNTRKIIFKPIFIVFMDLKIRCCRAEAHILNSPGLVPNISLQFTIFFYPLQYFLEFSRGDISILHCLWNDIGYAILLGLGKQFNSIVIFLLYDENFKGLSCNSGCKGTK